MHFKQLLALSFEWAAVLAANVPRTQALTAAGVPSYDYIVIGSGPGGGPLAARLASVGFKVLLIDAGSDQGNSLQETVPTLWPVSAQYAPMQWNYFVNHYADPARAQQDSKYTWQTPSGDYYIGPNPPINSTGLGILYPRAGTLGGCAAHNALIALYPHDDDYTYIENLTGDKSWSPRNMRLLFEKLEKNEYVGQGTSGHGRNGWFGTSVLDLSVLANDTKVDALAEAMYAAINDKKLGSVPKTARDLGKIMQLDVNGPGNTDKPNFYQLPLGVDNGTRSSPRDFILQIANEVNPNGTKKYSLDVWLDTLVTKILFDQTGSTPQAIGVEYIQGVGLYSATPAGVTQLPTGAGTVLAAKEVIISAGAFNTPQLLKLSGVGPKDELDSFDIPVVTDLPGVGQNLQDRYEMGVVSSTTSTFEILDGCTLISASPDLCLQQWQQGSNSAQRGFYGGNAFPLATVFKSSVAESDPDVFIFGGPVSFAGFFPGWANVSTLLPSSAPGWWSWVVLKAHSRNTAGNVTLRSVNPLDTPIVNFNSFDTGTTADNSDQLDLQASYEGIQLARQANANLAALITEYGSAYSGTGRQGLTPFTEVFPGPEHTGDDLKSIIKNEAFGHHASCTAAIGADTDPNAVLDSSFRVRGVKGLRVVDASSFPKTPGFFPAVPLYMMSEKAAIVIAKDAGVNITYSS